MQTEKGLVSVIVPCYNGKRFVDDCMNTLLAQSYKKLEIVVIDDGSTDGSYDSIMSYVSLFEEQGMRFICVRQENRGQSAAINTGLQNISGEFLQLLDIDDLLMPSSIEEKLQFFADDVAIVRSNGVTGTGNEDFEVLFTTDRVTGIEDNLFAELAEGTTYNWAGSYMIRTEPLFEFYKENSIYISRFGQHLQLLLPLAYNYKSIFINKPLMKYRRWENSHSAPTGSDNAFKKLETNMLGYLDIREYMINLIVADKRERDEYIRKARARAYLVNLIYSCQFNKKDSAKEYYKKIKGLNALDKDTKWIYRRFMYPIVGKIKDKLC